MLVTSSPWVPQQQVLGLDAGRRLCPSVFGVLRRGRWTWDVERRETVGRREGTPSGSIWSPSKVYSLIGGHLGGCVSHVSPLAASKTGGSTVVS